MTQDAHGANEPAAAANERTLLSLLNILLARRRVLLACAAGGLLAGVVLTLLRDPRYTAESSFFPKAQQTGGAGIAGLAAQFGIDAPGSTGGDSPEFYGELVRSPTILQRAGSTTYEFDADGEHMSGDMAALYDLGGSTGFERRRELTRLMNELVGTDVDIVTGIVTVRTSTRWPALSVAVNARLLELLSEFNLQRRQEQAAAERRFVEGRLAAAEAELTEAERTLEVFLTENRRYQSSPELSFDAGRLQRRVDLRQQVYASLAQALEEARIEEVRNTPVFTIIDQPGALVRPSHLGVPAGGVLGLLLGLIAGIAAAFFGEYMEARRRVHAAEYEDFMRLRRTLIPGRRGEGMRGKSGSGVAEHT